MITKEKNYFDIIYKVILVLLVALIAVFSFGLNTKKELNAAEVYSKSFNYIVEIKCVNSESDDIAYGSAVCISNNGEFITNAHVVTYQTTEQNGEKKINSFSKYFIRFPDSESYDEVELIKYDRAKDLAIVKMCNLTRKLKPVVIFDKYKTGDKCFAIGNSQNYGISISEGIVSKKQIKIKNGDVEITAIQCDLNITDGNSGGALLDTQGRLIGLTTFRIKDEMNKVIYGMSFALQAIDIKNFIN